MRRLVLARTRGRRRTTTLLGIGLAVTLVVGACGDGNGSDTAASDCGLQGGARCRPDRQRVDTAEPTFSNPTEITNPLFPTSTLAQVIQLGDEGGAPARVEVTLLPETKKVRWKGREIETVVRQFIAYSDRRVVEVALDFLAQADDGAVWYFGEDVFNYQDGRVANDEGTWLAGQDGPAGMIMPAHPEVGDVYRPENIPGFVFEEVTVKATDVTLPGPRGRVTGAIRTQEHLQENTFEDKVFAPGYGEFKIRAADELVFVALAVPVDAVAESTPSELETLVAGATDAFDAAASGDWTAASASLAAMRSAWDAYREGEVPELLATRMQDALDELGAAVEAHDAAGARQAAVDVTRAALDLELRYRPLVEVDLARLDAWTRQLLVDAAAEDAAGVAGDVAIMETIRDRIAHTLATAQLGQLDAALARARSAADDEDLPAVTRAATRLLGTLSEVEAEH